MASVLGLEPPSALMRASKLRDLQWDPLIPCGCLKRSESSFRVLGTLRCEGRRVLRTLGVSGACSDCLAAVF